MNGANHPRSWFDGTSLWIADHLPTGLLEQPERVLLNFCLGLIGIASLSPYVGTVPLAWPWWVRYSWALIMMVGAFISLFGTFTGDRWADRIGALLLAFATFYYGFYVLWFYGDVRLVSGIIFLAISVAKLIRFIRAQALRNRTTGYLREIYRRQQGEEFH